MAPWLSKFLGPGRSDLRGNVSREMLAAHNWLVPLYDGQPFFDKPPLFFMLQMASFSAFGATELAARLVSAVSAIALLLVVGWFGSRLFNRDVGRNSALMLAVLPGDLRALVACAIVDMTFTLFLFGGCALVTVAALDGEVLADAGPHSDHSDSSSVGSAFRRTTEHDCDTSRAMCCSLPPS